MATRSVSPGGALLRASRLFSVPAPLPRPVGDLASTVTFNSDTATLPHPIHLTITTPPSSLSKGDWGLKRPLPLRSTTKTSMPLIRVESVDTLEHITEFKSAADHTLTLQKWQEMNMPLSTPSANERRIRKLASQGTPGRGVFEELVDSPADGKSKTAEEEARWKFGGPWLAGQTVAEFNNFVQKVVRGRKAEFQMFLRENKALEDTRTAQLKAAEQGEDAPPAVMPSDITDEQLKNYTQELRQDRAALFRLIRMFLDLPPSPSPKGYLMEAMEDVIDYIGTNSASKTLTLNSEDYLPKSNSPYADTGPPKTHPSAGLSYLRTGRHLYNHPVFGPQKTPPPIQGRILMPKNAAVGSFAPKVGIAGIVADAPTGEGFNTSNGLKTRHGRARKETHPGLINIEPDKVGGSKIYLHPSKASIDSKGRLSLEVLPGDGPAVAIHEGSVGQIPANSKRTMQPIKPLPRPPSTTPQWYGLESPDAFRESTHAADNERGIRGSSNNESAPALVD